MPVPVPPGEADYPYDLGEVEGFGEDVVTAKIQDLPPEGIVGEPGGDNERLWNRKAREFPK